MTDLFADKNVKPMLIAEMQEAFDSPDYIYELKLDGERCIAYLDPEGGTELRNKRNVRMLPKVPELADIHRHVSRRCILDGELAIIKNGRPNFAEIQRRSLMSSPVKIELAAKQSPACFTAFDILYVDGQTVNDLPVLKRKDLLQDVLLSESPRFAVSRYIDRYGTAFYELAKSQNLEGIVAKRKDSKYVFGKRTKEWIKIKNLKDDDFVVCGFIPKGSMTSLVLGQYQDGELIYQGHVTLGVSRAGLQDIPRGDCPFGEMPAGNEDAVWLAPERVCTVRYMERTASGHMRQPVFHGWRDDKVPQDCIRSL